MHYYAMAEQFEGQLRERLATEGQTAFSGVDQDEIMKDFSMLRFMETRST